MTAICFGSLAYDRLLTYSGAFTDSLMADKLDLVSLSFVAEGLNIAVGGTGGNIAYNLGLLGEKPITVGCLGSDPDGADYLRHFTEMGLSTSGIKVHQGHATAGCTIATDKNNSQFTFFHPGAMMLPSGFDLSQLAAPLTDHLVIISPAGFDEMKSLAADCRRLGLRFIFDPGQQIPAFSGPEMIEMLEESYMLICNEYEFGLFCEKTGLNRESIFQYTQTVVVTLGEKGSELLVPGRGSQHIPSIPLGHLSAVNPTGAGDAFRAGLIKGLMMGEHLVTACRLGSTVASFCVEATEGPQSQKFTLAQVAGRHASAFKEQLNLF